VHPFFMAYTIWLIATGSFFPERAGLVGTAVVGLNLAVIVFG